MAASTGSWEECAEGCEYAEGCHSGYFYAPSGSCYFFGIGGYAFAEDAHLTEANETGLLTTANKRRLFSEWARFWPSEVLRNLRCILPDLFTSLERGGSVDLCAEALVVNLLACPSPDDPLGFSLYGAGLRVAVAACDPDAWAAADAYGPSDGQARGGDDVDELRHGWGMTLGGC